MQAAVREGGGGGGGGGRRGRGRGREESKGLQTEAAEKLTN